MYLKLFISLVLKAHLTLNCSAILLFNFFLSIVTVNGMKWPTKEEELIDEIRDDELLKTVQKSMQEWEKLHNRKHRKKRADNIVCYGELGCFEESGPFGYFDMLPASPEEINTKFYFYSTKNRYLNKKTIINYNIFFFYINCTY